MGSEASPCSLVTGTGYAGVFKRLRNGKGMLRDQFPIPDLWCRSRNFDFFERLPVASRAGHLNGYRFAGKLQLRPLTRS